MSNGTTGDTNKVNLIAALGTGATAAVVLWIFLIYSRDSADRAHVQAVETRKQLLDYARENRDAIKILMDRQAEVILNNTQSILVLNETMRRISVRVEPASQSARMAPR